MLLHEIIIPFGIVIGICLILLFAHREKADIWTRLVCYIVIAITAGIGTLRVYNIIKLRKVAKEVPLCYQITTDENQHFSHTKAVYVETKNDNTSAIYSEEKRLLLDSIRYLGVHHIGVNDTDTFDLIEYIAPNGDTLLYDAYLGIAILPEQFEPHYKDAMYWEFNFSNI